MAKHMRLWLYFIFTIIIGLGWILLAFFIPNQFVELAGNIYKTCLIVILCVILKRWNTNTFRPLDLFLAIIPGMIELIGFAVPLYYYPGHITILLYILGIVLTAIWEELFFRALPVQWIQIESIYDIAFITLVFSASHIFNILTGSPLSTFLQIILAYCFGFFMMVLYLNTGNIVLNMFAHFVLNFCCNFYTLFTTSDESLFFKGEQFIVLGIVCLYCLVAGIILYVKSDQNRFLTR